MGALIAVGLAMLLLWRLLIFLYDRKEYAKFLKDAQNARWNTVSRITINKINTSENLNYLLTGK